MIIENKMFNICVQNIYFINKYKTYSYNFYAYYNFINKVMINDYSIQIISKILKKYDYGRNYLLFFWRHLKRLVYVNE